MVSEYKDQTADDDESIRPRPRRKRVGTERADDAHNTVSQRGMDSRRKDEFLASLAHELRSPLVPLKNALEILKQPDIDEHVRANAQALMERQVDIMVHLVDELMEAGRYGLSVIKLRRQRVDFAEVLKRALDSTQCALERSQHTLEVDLPHPIELNADPVRLQQVLVNLIMNAIKYTDDGGVLRISARETGGVVEFRITDSGIGIAPAALNMIFELFNRENRPVAHVREGFGIGLTVVRRLVDAHGGSVHAFSDGPGSGSTFVVQLPR